MVLYTNLEGCYFPHFFPKENYYLMKNLRLRDNDIVLSTYPKSGSHWVAYIIWCMRNPGAPVPEGSRIIYEVSFVDKFGLAYWKDSPEDQSRTLFTHLPVSMLQKNPHAKYVIVARNPMDCCASFYHFLKSHRDEYSFEEDGLEIPNSFVEEFVKGEIPYGCFFKYIKSWYGFRNEDNVHLVVYEKLKANPRGEILRLGRFLGYEEQLHANGGQLLEDIIDRTSFSVMKAELTFVYDGNASVPVLRKGESGGYRSSLTANQIELIKAKMEEELAGTEMLDVWRNV